MKDGEETEFRPWNLGGGDRVVLMGGEKAVLLRKSNKRDIVWIIGSNGMLRTVGSAMIKEKV